jgi:S1-C subfamily serine protease
MLLSTAVADAVERAAGYTVMVRARRRLPSSGIVFAQDLVLTANHAVERDEEIQVGLPDGQVVDASLAGRDRGTDLALLRLSGGPGLAPAQAGAGGNPRVGNLVVAVGRPAAEGVQASFGMLTAIGAGLRTHRGALLERFLETDAVPLPGFSGGPLVDLAGGLLGINTSGLVRGAAIAIPADTAWGIAGSLAQHGRVRRGYLGIRSQIVELPDRALETLRAAGLEREQASGLLLVGVEPDGPAAGGELMIGDILVGLGGQPVVDHDDLIAGLAGVEVDQPAEIQVLRGGELRTVRVQVGDRQ